MAELHLTITAETAHQALNELVEIGKRASEMFGGSSQPANTADTGNGAEPPKRTRSSRAKAAEDGPAPPPPAPEFDRAEIIDGLTKLYMGGVPNIREKITAFRDGHGVQRLRELKDDALPGAAALLAELQQAEAAAP